MLCTERSLVKHGSNTLSVRPLRCKRWSCEHCRGRRAKDLWHKAFNGQPDMFLTLTKRPVEGQTPEQAAEAFVVEWRSLRQFLCRRLDRKSLTFLAVFEAHESGWPHLHILLRSKYIDRRLIVEWWEARTGSFEVDIRRVHNPRQRASYVSKYVAKRPSQFGSCKRFWCSQDWDPPKKEDPNQAEEVAWWEAVSISPKALAEAALADGGSIKWVGGDLLVIERWSWRERQRWGLG